MHDFRRIRQYLTKEVDILVTNATVCSRLDYCNFLFRGLSSFNQHKLQSNQNTSTHIVTVHRNYAHVIPILRRLHWLPVNYRGTFKATTLVYKVLHSDFLSYFGPSLSLSSCSYITRRRHPDGQYLTVSSFHSSLYKSFKYFGHSFVFDAPKTWNDLPDNVCNAKSIASFRKMVKTYLFTKKQQQTNKQKLSAMTSLSILFSLGYVTWLCHWT